MGELPLKDYQDVYFSRPVYGEVTPLFDTDQLAPATPESRVSAVAGIADPEHFFDKVRELFPETEELIVYDDHHPYDEDDLEELRELIQEPDCFLITTEKDGMRLLSHADQLTPEERSRILYLPIEVSLSPKQERRFRERLQRAIKNNGLHL